MESDFLPKPPKVDLLGEPWTEQRDPRGRKSHRRTVQIAETVALLRGTGTTKEEIADRVGLSVPTLEKYYFRELKKGPALLKAVLTEALWAKAKGGNVAAARFIAEQLEKGEAAVPIGSSKPASPEAASDAKADKPEGKKAAALAAAETAHEGSEWGNLLKH